jgi:TonB family protein
MSDNRGLAVFTCGSSGVSQIEVVAMAIEVRVTCLNRNDRMNPRRWIPADYPPEAVAARVQGVVIVELAVGSDGKVANTRIVRSVPLLDAAARAAVAQWEFAPALAEGIPAPDTQTIAMQFELP